MQPILESAAQSVIGGRKAEVERFVAQALAAGISPQAILDDGLIAPMAEVGARFERGEFYVPEMLIAARAMQNGLALLKPHLASANVKSQGKVVAGTVKGDLHDIGKNLVCMMLEGAAFEIVDLGSDVTPEKFVEAVRSTGANVICLSALLTTTMPSMKTTIEALKAAGLRDKVKVMVGGAPLTDQYAHEIGADGYAPDASRAVALAKVLLSA